MSRYYMGVDWADQEHAVWVEDEHGAMNKKKCYSGVRGGSAAL